MVTWRSHLAAVLAIAREKRITADAASLAFYACNVLVALLVLVSATFSVLGTGTAFAASLQVLTGVDAAELQRLLERAGSRPAGRRRAVGLAVLVSAWSSLRLFRAVESVFVDVYEIRTERTLLQRVTESVLVFLSVTLIGVVMVAMGSYFVFRSRERVWMLLSPVLLWLSLFVLFLPLYYQFSSSAVSVRETLPGTAVAAAGWTLSALGLRLYVTVSESVDLFGVVGAVLLVLTWLYVVGLAIVLGAVLNAVLAGRIEADQEWLVG